MSSDAGHLSVSDELDWISAARILSNARVGVIHVAPFLIKDDIFQNRSKMERLENVRL
jgi:hypothetical protein